VVATHASQELKIAELQQFCGTRIPKYMIPEQIEFCESLPKTSTGKIDRVRLTQDTGRQTVQV
jgi:acyl-coenzyme A synthetase/AMP-(fatty) acid ligase